jgi:hypothetical protein
VDNYEAAKSLSALANVPADWILGWAASESSATDGSGYGQSSLAILNQNYFGQRGMDWIGTTFDIETCVSDWACFLNFQASATSALLTAHQNWTSNGTPPVSAGQILASFGGKNASAAFQALADSGQDRGNLNYGSRVAATIHGLDTRVSCLKNYGYL